MSKLSGHYEISGAFGEKVRAFIPNPLPPNGLDISPVLRLKMDQALIALGRLDSVALLLPKKELFLYSYVRKEAVLSSQIEGTQSTLSDLLIYEVEGVPGVPLDDVIEVSNYVAALNHGLNRLRADFPLSMRLLKEMHGILLSKGRGASKNPGEIRTSQNWIGGSRPGNALFVPPPPHRLGETLSPWEHFLHDEPVRHEVLIKAALAHVQFETIHPFLDGNGRLGRLLITLIFCSEGVLKEPMLYLSLFLRRNRQAYYDLLQKVRLEGAWTDWLTFFTDAVNTTAEEAVETARQLNDLAGRDFKRIGAIGRTAGSALRLHDAFLEHPILSLQAACNMTGLAPNTVLKVFNQLMKAGIVSEITGKKRNRMFVYKEYVEALEGKN